MFGFAKAFYESGVTAKEAESMSKEQLSNYVQALDRAKNMVTFSPQEQKQIDALVNKAVRPIDKLIGKKKLPKFQAGKAYTVKGSKYKYLGNDQWKKL